MRLVDRVSRSETKIVVVDRVSRSDTRIVGDRSVTFWHQDSKMNEYWGDRSVTFRHQDSKENESWIMLIYSDLKNLFPKWVWCGGLSPHRCAWVMANAYGTCCCHLLSIWLVLCYYSIYIAFYFELADDTYSVLVPCTDPYFYVSLFVIYGNAANVPSTSTQPQLYPVFIASDFRVSYCS